MALSQNQRQELTAIFKEDVAFDVPLSQHTSIKVGGAADCFIWPRDTEALKMAIQFARAKELPFLVLGKGSNTLVRDGGFPGMVVSLDRGFRHFAKAKENGNTVWIQAQGGVPTQQLVRWSALEGLSGLERLAGVPGTVGGNVFMNAGTYLGEIGELIEAVELCDRQGQSKILPKAKLKFAYRNSNLPPASVVVQALFQLTRGKKEAIETKIREVFEKRGLAQPIELPNLGSVFKNPGKQKAWELIEESGLKGVRVGKARISEKHANFIVNEGGATAKDVEILIRMVKDRVKQTTGITLETEIRIIGEE